MFGPFLITLREGLEAALIVGIVLAFLARTGNYRGFRPVWFGTALAVLVSLLAGGIVYLFAGELGDPAEAIFEGIALLIAVAVLTWMIFWMRQQSIHLKTNLQTRVQSALTRGSMAGLASIAFLAVVREGIETVLFLFAANSASDSPALFVAGGLAGLLIALAIGYAIYKNSSRLNLKSFFNITGLLLIVFAAGLLAHGIHEFNEVGFIPPVVEHLWDSNGLISESSTFGRFLTALLGYNGNPSLTEVIAYFVYLVPSLVIYIWSTRNQLKEAASDLPAIKQGTCRS